MQRQDGVLHLDQLDLSLSEDAAHKRVRRGQWQRLLPRVVMTTAGRPSRRQLLVAAWLYAGADAAIDGADACEWHCAGVATKTDIVHVVTVESSSARSRDFVRVRRSMSEIRIGGRGFVPYVDPATGLIVAARNAKSRREATAVLSRGLQKGMVTLVALQEARERIGDKWCRGVDAALLAVGVGLRSPAEKDARDLFLSSRVLPEPLWNQWLDLADGGCPVCVDALWEDAALVNEVLGKRYHAWGDQFESTEARRGRIVAAGLVVQGCTATQLRAAGPSVLARVEQTYLRNAGRGLPPGVRLIAAPIAA